MASQPNAVAVADSQPAAATQGFRSAETAVDAFRQPMETAAASGDSERTRSLPQRESRQDGDAPCDQLPSPPEVQIAGGRLSAVPEEASEDGRSSSSSVLSGGAVLNRPIGIASAVDVTATSATERPSLPDADRRLTPPPSLRLPPQEPREWRQAEPSVGAPSRTARQEQQQQRQRIVVSQGDDNATAVATHVASELAEPLLSHGQAQRLDGASGSRGTASSEMQPHSRPARASFRVMIEKHSDEAPLQATVAVQQAPVARDAHAGSDPSPSPSHAELSSRCDSMSDRGDVSIETVPERIVNVTTNTVLSTSSSTVQCESPAESHAKKIVQKPGTVLQGIAYGLGNAVEASDVQVKRFFGGQRRMALNDMAAHRTERRPKVQITVSTTTVPTRGGNVAAAPDAASATAQNVVHGLTLPTSGDTSNQTGTVDLRLPAPASQITVRHEISAGSQPLLGALMERLIAAGGRAAVEGSSATAEANATAGATAGAASRDETRLLALERKLQLAEKQVDSLQAQLQDRQPGVQGELLTLIMANQQAVQTQLQTLAAQAALQRNQPTPAARATEVVARHPNPPAARPCSPPERLLPEPSVDSSRTPAPRVKQPVPSARPEVSSNSVGSCLSAGGAQPIASTHRKVQSCGGSAVDNALKGNGESAAAGLLAELLAMDAASPQQKSAGPPSPASRSNEPLMTEIVQLKEKVDSLLAEQKLARRLEHRKALVDPAPVDRLTKAASAISPLGELLKPRSAARGGAVDNLDATFLADTTAAPKRGTVGSFVASALDDLARLKAKESDIEESLATVERMCRRAELDERLRALADFSSAAAGGPADSDVSRAVSVAAMSAVPSASIDNLTDKSRVKLVVNQHLAAASQEVQEKLAALAAREASIARQQRVNTKRAPTISTNVAFGRTTRIPGGGKDDLKVVSAKVDSGLHLQRGQDIATSHSVDKENYPCRADAIVSVPVDSYKDEHYIRRVYGRALYDNQRRTTQRCTASPKSLLRRPMPYKSVSAKRMKSAKVQVQESPSSRHQVTYFDTSMNDQYQPSTMSKAVAIIPSAPVCSPVTIVLGPGMTTADFKPYTAFVPTTLPMSDSPSKAVPSQHQPPSLATASAAAVVTAPPHRSARHPAAKPPEVAKKTAEHARSLSPLAAKPPVSTSDESPTSRRVATSKVANDEAAGHSTANGKRGARMFANDDQTPESDDAVDSMDFSANRNNNADSRSGQRMEKERASDNSDASSAGFPAERSTVQQSDDELSSHRECSSDSETAYERMDENENEDRQKLVPSMVDRSDATASQAPLQNQPAREEDCLPGMRSWQAYIEPQFQYEESVVEEQCSREDEIPDPPIRFDGHRQPSPARHSGPTFPPRATARPLGASLTSTARSATTAVATATPRDPVMSVDLDWVERQLMARIVQRMLSEPEVGVSTWDAAAAAASQLSRPSVRTTTHLSSTAVPLREGPLDHQVFVDVDDEQIDDVTLEALVRECLLERLRTMLGTRREVLRRDPLDTAAELEPSGRRRAASSEPASDATPPVHVVTPHATPPRVVSPVSRDNRMVTPDITPARSDESISSVENIASQLIAANPELAADGTVASTRGASASRLKATGEIPQAFNLSQVSLWDTTTLGFNRTLQPGMSSGLESGGVKEPAVDQSAFGGTVSHQQHDVLTPACTPPPTSPPSTDSSAHEAARDFAVRVRTPTPTSPSEDEEEQPEPSSFADAPVSAAAAGAPPVEGVVAAAVPATLTGGFSGSAPDGPAPVPLSPKIRTIAASTAALTVVRAAADHDSFEASASDEVSHGEPGHASAITTITETMNEPLSEGEWLLKSEGQMTSKRASGDAGVQQSDSNSTLSSDEELYASMAPVATAGDLSDGELRTVPQHAPQKEAEQQQRSPLLSLLAKVQEPVIRLHDSGTAATAAGADGGPTRRQATAELPGGRSGQAAAALSTRSGRRSPGEVYPSRTLATSAEKALELAGSSGVVDDAAASQPAPAVSAVAAVVAEDRVIGRERGGSDVRQPSTSGSGDDDDGGDGDTSDAFVRSHSITVRPRPVPDAGGSYGKSDDTPTRAGGASGGWSVAPSRGRPLFGMVQSTAEQRRSGPAAAMLRSGDGAAATAYAPAALGSSASLGGRGSNAAGPAAPVIVPQPLPTGVFSRSSVIAVPLPGDAGLVAGDASIDTASVSLPQNSLDASQAMESTHSTDRIDIDSLVKSAAYAASQTLSGTWEPSVAGTASADVGILQSHLHRSGTLSADVRYDEPDLDGSNASWYEQRSAPSESHSADEMSDQHSTSFG